MLKKALLAALVASSFGAVTIPSAQAEVIVRVAPPEARYERIPPPRAGYVWENGHWRWNGQRYVWVRGHWERERPGYVFHSPRWIERNGRWEYQARRWDRDGDGIANRYDRDRDGDGVRNRDDRYPNNPNRS